MTLVRDVALGIWFAVVGLAFWGPYGGLPLGDGAPLYGVYLAAALIALALRWTRRRGASALAGAVPRTGNEEGAQRGQG